MEDDRDVFLPPKKFRYKTLHRQEPAVTEFVAEQRSRLPFKKTALTAYRTATATTAEEIVSVPTPVSPPAQMSPASACSGASMEPSPLKLPFCPYCQLPFNILVSTAPMHHLAECGQMDRSRQPECPDTVHCQSSVAAHYARYSHLALARLRAYHSAAAAASHSLLTVPGAGGGGPPPPQVHRDVQHLRQEAGFYPAPRPPAGASLPSVHFSASASNLQLLREARQQPSLATAVPGAAAGRVTHSPHGSLHSPLSVSLGSPHPSPASPQAPSPLPATVATPSVTLGRCSPSSELLPMRSRANTMSPPRGGRRYGCRPRSGSFNLPPRPRSSASLSLPPRRAGFSIAEIMEPTAAAAGGEGGALDLSVRRRRQPDSELLQEDRQDSVSECVSDVAERYLEEDSKQSSRTAHDSGISEIHRAGDHSAGQQRPNTDSCSGGSKMTISGESIRSQGATISQPPKKRRLAAVSSSPEDPARQVAITGYFPPVTSAPGVGAGAVDTGGGGGREPPPPPTTAADERTMGRADAERPAATMKAECSAEDTKQQWAKIMSKMRPSAVTPAQHQRAQTNGAPPSGDRKCPFYKLIPGAPFAVDAFNYGPVSGVEAYFLSHFHYDHYRGLTKAFPKTLYCGRVTGNLVLSRLKVPADRVKMLPMNEPRRVFNVEVTLLDANHCPGAVMFLFKLADGRAFLHVGDFRADPSMESYPELWNTAIDRLYLDTTYCDPVYDFPSQSDILHQCVRIVNEAIQKNPKTLIVCGSYTIGKERVFLTVAEALDCLFWASADKRRTLQCLEERQIKRRLTTDQRLARIHVLPLGHLTMKTLQNYLKIFQSQYTHIVAIKPTGWEHGKDAEKHGDFKPKVSGNIAIYGVPYSEHSSYSELRRFVQFVQPREIIPTVNVGSAASRGLMEAQFRQWLSEAPLRPRLTPPLPPPPPPPPPVGSAAGPSGGVGQKERAANETRREVKVTTC